MKEPRRRLILSVVLGVVSVLLAGGFSVTSAQVPWSLKMIAPIEVAISVTDMDKMLKFYVDVLGLKKFNEATVPPEMTTRVGQTPFGLRVIRTPGHTPGHQSVLVDTGGGRYCIAGDAVMWHENLDRMIPPGVLTSVIDCMASLERIKREADHVLPSHEPKLFGKSPARFP